MRRITSFSSPVDTAVDREIDSKYDVIKSVSEQIAAIEDINAAIADGTLVNMLDIINMVVATGAEGTNATWDGTTLTVPRGDTGATGATGAQGFNGVTPRYEFMYNETSGNLEYEEVGFVNLNTGDEFDLEGVEDILDRKEEW